MNPIDRLSAADFTPYLGKVLRVESCAVELVLAAVDETAYRGWESAPRPPFSLILRGAAGAILPEGLYRIAIEDGPVLPLYVIPILTPARGHQDYQVVFN